MPKSDLNIESFDGVHGSAGSESLPLGVFEYASGLDPTRSPGKFVGLPEDTLLTEFLGKDLRGWILTEDGTTAVCYTTVGGAGSEMDELWVVTGLPDAPTLQTVTPTSISTIAGVSSPVFGGGISDGNSVFIATGLESAWVWVGQIAGNWQAKAGYPKRPLIADGYTITASATPWTPSANGSHATNDPERPFIDGRSYAWRFTFLYDNRYESSLSDSILELVADGNKESVGITLATPLPDDRVTHVIVYRADGATASIEDRILYPWQDLNAAFGTPTPPIAQVNPTSGFAEDTLGQYRRVKVYEVDEIVLGVLLLTDEGSIGPSYYDQTGLPQSLETQNIGIGLLIRYENKAYAAGVNVLDEDADNEQGPYKLLGSQDYRFASFNWSGGFHKLDTRPTALAQFQHRIWAFDQGSVTVLQPNLSDPEVLYGIGAEGLNSVFTTEAGMIALGDRQIWFNDRRGFRDIGDPILSLTDNNGLAVGYNDRQTATTNTPLALYDGTRNLFIVVYELVGGTTRMCVFDTKREIWSHMGTPVQQFWDGFTLKTGAILVGNEAPLASNSSLYTLFSDPITRAFSIRTKTFREGSRRQVYFNAYIQGDTPSSAKYKENGDTKQTAAYSTVDGLEKATINSSPRTVAGTAWKRVRSFQKELEYGMSTEFDTLTLQRNVDPII